MKGRTFNTANLPVCLIDFNYTRDTNTAKFDSYFRHFGESVIFVFRQTKSKFAHGEWRSLSANPDVWMIILLNCLLFITCWMHCCCWYLFVLVLVHIVFSYKKLLKGDSMERYPERCFHIIAPGQPKFDFNTSSISPLYETSYKTLIFYYKQIKIMSMPQ